MITQNTHYFTEYPQQNVWEEASKPENAFNRILLLRTGEFVLQCNASNVCFTTFQLRDVLVCDELVCVFCCDHNRIEKFITLLRTLPSPLSLFSTRSVCILNSISIEFIKTNSKFFFRCGAYHTHTHIICHLFVTWCKLTNHRICDLSTLSIVTSFRFSPGFHMLFALHHIENNKRAANTPAHYKWVKNLYTILIE